MQELHQVPLNERENRIRWRLRWRRLCFVTVLLYGVYIKYRIIVQTKTEDLAHDLLPRFSK
jgi:hypothetical protein